MLAGLDAGKTRRLLERLEGWAAVDADGEDRQERDVDAEDRCRLGAHQRLELCRDRRGGRIAGRSLLRRRRREGEREQQHVQERARESPPAGPGTQETALALSTSFMCSTTIW